MGQLGSMEPQYLVKRGEQREGLSTPHPQVAARLTQGRQSRGVGARTFEERLLETLPLCCKTTRQWPEVRLNWSRELLHILRQWPPCCRVKSSDHIAGSLIVIYWLNFSSCGPSLYEHLDVVLVWEDACFTRLCFSLIDTGLMLLRGVHIFCLRKRGSAADAVKTFPLSFSYELSGFIPPS